MTHWTGTLSACMSQARKRKDFRVHVLRVCDWGDQRSDGLPGGYTLTPVLPWMRPDGQVTEIPHTAPLKKDLPSMPGVCLENSCQ